MDGLIYLIGLIVVIMAILCFSVSARIGGNEHRNG